MLVEELITASDDVLNDPWSPFAIEWRRRAEALLAALPSAAPYYKKWLASEARAFERPYEADEADQQTPEQRRAETAMIDHAARLHEQDIQTLRDARRHVDTFGDPKERAVLGDVPSPRESSWDPRPFVPMRRKAALRVDVPRPSPEPDAFTEASRQDARGSRQQEAHTIFQRIGGSNKPSPKKADDPVRVFVVHGHDRGTRDSVQLLLLRLELQPIVLEDQANRGRTLVEKFEAHADVQYGVVILAPEDECGSNDGVTLRPRQNVILELGYLMGRLGRDRVAAIVVGKSERPSDVDGLAYIPFDDAGAWRTKLAQELRAAGISVDMNRIG